MKNINKRILEELANGAIPLYEMLNESETIEFTDSIDHSKKRKVKASKNGKIEVIDEIREIGAPVETEYKYDYNVSTKSFKLEVYDYYNDINFKLEDNKYETRIDKDNLSLIKLKQSGKFKTTYQEKSILDDTSVLIAAYGKNKKIEKLNIDIRTHKKSTGKINGVFALRIDPMHRKIDLRHINRKGLSTCDFSTILFDINNELYDTIMNGYTIEDKSIPEIVNTVILASNYWIDSYNYCNNIPKNYVSLGSISIPNFDEEIKKVVDVVDDLQKDMYLPHLKKNLSSFVNEYQTKEKNSSKTLQKKM